MTVTTTERTRPAPRRLHRHGLVVGRARRRHRAVGQAEDRGLLYAFGGQAVGLCQEIPLPSGGELSRRSSPTARSRRSSTPRPTTCICRPRAPRPKPASTSSSTSRSPTMFPMAAPSRNVPRGRRGAGVGLSAPPREPLPLDQEADRRRAVRQARQCRGQHQPRSARPVRSRLLALSGRRHAGRRHAADRHPLHRRAGIPGRAGQGGARAVRATGAAGRQPRRGEPDPGA